MINVISSGEIEKGMYIVGYESVERKEPKRANIFGIELPGNEEEEEKDEFEVNMFPWFKGIPFRVIAVAGPMIAVKSNGYIRNNARMSPVFFFDGRITRFVEVNEQYYNDFWETSNQALKTTGIQYEYK